jgi:hypothetical protein
MPESARSGIEVPGAYVALDPYRGRSKVVFWMKNMGLGFLSRGDSAFYSVMTQDVVVRDSDDSRELYREGPLSRSSAISAMNRYAEEIRRIGLDEFLRKRQIELAQLGPIVVPSGHVGVVLSSLRGLVDTVIRRKRRT